MSRAQHDRASDEQLIRRVRGGDAGAYAELWRRHADAARRTAWQFRATADPDDLVSESYTRILEALRRGKGPRGPFRPYLYATVRNLVSEIVRSSRADTADYLDDLVDPSTEHDRAVRALDNSLTARAFRTLPERWQSVLWYTEVEGMTPQQAAPLLGLAPNACSALAYRAREGLRTAWLQAHITDDGTSAECRWMLTRLGAYARRALPKRDLERAERHLAGCARCVIVSEEVDEVGSRLAVVLLPLLVGGTAAFGMLDTMRATPAHAGTRPDAPGPGASTRGGPTRTVTTVVTAGAVVAISAAAAVAVTIAVSAPVATTALSPGLPPPAAAAPAVPTAAPPSPRPTDERPAIDPALPDPPPEEAPAPPNPDPAPVPRPAPEPVPAPEPEPEPDTERPPPLVPPAVTAYIDDDPGVRPSLHGTAHPFAAVEVRDQLGALVAAVVADGDGTWATRLDALSATATALTVTQTADGTTSEPAELGPFAFTPLVSAPSAVPASEWFDLEVIGWAGSGYFIEFEHPDIEPGELGPLLMPDTGRAGFSAQLGPGELIVRVRYAADPAPTPVAAFTVTVS